MSGKTFGPSRRGNFNRLSAAQTERFALLLEECGEAVHILGKILRHGLDSTNPLSTLSDTNRDMLEKELGDVLCAVDLLVEAHDLRDETINSNRLSKRARVAQYLHHNRVQQ